MWLERHIIRKAERRLSPFRTQAEMFKQQKTAEYQQYLPHISTLYTQATHWHGTGRYHYRNQKDSRYEDVGDDAVVDILAGILECDGLKPHADPWINSGGKTVSLATVRMHARIFARVHADEKGILLYELGSIKYWLRLYFVLLLLWLSTGFRSQIPLIKSLFRRSFFKNLKNRSSELRKPTNNILVTIFEILRGNIPTSDIAGNYPILIGAAVLPEDLIETIPLTNKVEQRSLRPVTLAQFTHIEVPLDKITETEKILSDKGIHLPVIPLEFGDLYLSDQPLVKLAYS